MKTAITLMVLLILGFGLVSCGGKDAQSKVGSSPAVSPSVTGDAEADSVTAEISDADSLDSDLAELDSLENDLNLEI